MLWGRLSTKFLSFVTIPNRRFANISYCAPLFSIRYSGLFAIRDYSLFVIRDYLLCAMRVSTPPPAYLFSPFPPTLLLASFLVTCFSLLLCPLSCLVVSLRPCFLDPLLPYFLSCIHSFSSCFSCFLPSCSLYFNWDDFVLIQSVLGAHYQEGSPTSVQETINVTKVISNREFSWMTGKNDVALLKLAKPITPSDKVNTVCLPQSKKDLISPGKNCFITGKVVQCRYYLTIILRNRAEYRLILSRRGRRPRRELVDWGTV